MRKLVAFVVLLAFFAVGPVVATAATAWAANNDYGHHVATCTHEMGGFSGTQNPGMHHGRSGWDGSPC
jgi:hypothetical protein